MYGMLLALTTSGPALGAVVLNRLAITLVEILLFGVGVASWRFRRTKKENCRVGGAFVHLTNRSSALGAFVSLGGASTYSRSVPGRDRNVLTRLASSQEPAERKSLHFADNDAADLAPRRRGARSLAVWRQFVRVPSVTVHRVARAARAGRSR